MTDIVDLWEKPVANEIFMLVGWRQWADAGSVSSGLPQYLIQRTNARQIGKVQSDGFYLFQFPGTHDLVRPVVRFDEGLPESLQTRRNEIYYAGDEQSGLVIFLGDEPHLEVEKYVASLLHIAETLKVKRIIGFGGVYGELPYDKERLVSSVYSLPYLKEELEQLSVNLSDYHGGASIGSYICKRAGERKIEFVSLYAFVPTYDFSNISQISSSIRIENDYIAWLGIMRRVNHMLKLGADLTDLEQKSQQLIEQIEAKVEEIESAVPEAGVKDYLKHLSDDFQEISFNPLDEVWEQEMRRIFDKLDEDE
jgi:predicted ATP-grasp superfamily ATP-dependent carboligase